MKETESLRSTDRVLQPRTVEQRIGRIFPRVQQGRKCNYLVLEFMRLAEEDGKMNCGDMVWGDFSVQEIILPCKRSSHKLLKS